MRKVKAGVLFGEFLFFDQCERCGGIWFDRDELFRLSVTEFDTSPPIDTKIFRRKESLLTEKLFCPNDKERLSSFQDKNFPSDIQVEHCVKCGGFWMNRGEYSRYHAYRVTLRKENEATQKDSAFSEKIEELLNAHKGTDMYDVMGRLASFLSTPIQQPFLSNHYTIPYRDKEEDAMFKEKISSFKNIQQEDIRIQTILDHIRKNNELDEDNLRRANGIVRIIFQVLQILLKVFIGR